MGGARGTTPSAPLLRCIGTSLGGCYAGNVDLLGGSMTSAGRARNPRADERHPGRATQKSGNRDRGQGADEVKGTRAPATLQVADM